MFPPSLDTRSLSPGQWLSELPLESVIDIKGTLVEASVKSCTQSNVELQLEHPSTPSVVVRNMLEGHVDVHVLAPASKVAPGTQEVQAAAPEPLQVAHEASHATHVLLASANLPFGQALTHEPSS